MYFLFCLKTVYWHYLLEIETQSARPEISWHQISVICGIPCRVRHLPESWKVVPWQSLLFLSTRNRKKKLCKKGFVSEGSRLIGRLPAIWLISVSGGVRGQNAKTFPLLLLLQIEDDYWGFAPNLLWQIYFKEGPEMRSSLKWLLPREKRQVAKTAIRALHKNSIF